MIDVMKKWLQGISEIIIAFPIILILGLLLVPENQLWLWIVSLSIYYLIGIGIRNTLGARLRLLQLSISLVITCFVSLIIMGIPYGPQPIAQYIGTCIIGLFLIYRGIRFVEFSWEQLLPPVYFFISIGAYCVGSFIFSKIIYLQTYLGVLIWFGCIALVISLIQINHMKLNGITLNQEGTGLPITILKHNRRLLSIVLIMILLLSGWRQLIDGFFFLIRTMIYWVFNILSSLFSTSTAEDPPKKNMSNLLQQLAPPPDDKGVSIWQQIFQIIVLIVCAVLALCLLVLVIRAAYKGIRWLLMKLKTLLQGQESFSGINTGYIDEKELVIDWKIAGKKYTDNIKAWISQLLEREPKWDELKNNKERVRYLYFHSLLRFISKGYEHKKYFSPNETLMDLEAWREEDNTEMSHITNLYNDVRYGEKEITDTAVQEFKNKYVD